MEEMTKDFFLKENSFLHHLNKSNHQLRVNPPRYTAFLTILTLCGKMVMFGGCVYLHVVTYNWYPWEELNYKVYLHLALAPK